MYHWDLDSLLLEMQRGREMGEMGCEWMMMMMLEAAAPLNNTGEGG